MFLLKVFHCETHCKNHLLVISIYLLNFSIHFRSTLLIILLQKYSIFEITLKILYQKRHLKVLNY